MTIPTRPSPCFTRPSETTRTFVSPTWSWERSILLRKTTNRPSPLFYKPSSSSPVSPMRIISWEGYTRPREEKLKLRRNSQQFENCGRRPTRALLKRCLPQQLQSRLTRTRIERRLRPALFCRHSRLFACDFPGTFGPVQHRLSATLDPVVVIGLAYRPERFVVQAGQAERHLQFFREILQSLQLLGACRNLILRGLQKLLISSVYQF